jgi:hypothetical protein
MPYDSSNYLPEQQGPIQALINKVYGYSVLNALSLYTATDIVTPELFNLRNREIQGLLSYLEDLRRDETNRATLAEQALDSKYKDVAKALGGSNGIVTPFTGVVSFINPGYELTLSEGQAFADGELLGLPYTNYSVSFTANVNEKLVLSYSGALTVRPAAYTLAALEQVVGLWDGATNTYNQEPVAASVTNVELKTNKNQPSGYAGLDSSGLLLPSVIPGSSLLQSLNIYRANAIPTSGAYTAGDVILNTAPQAGFETGWICVQSGTPGVWSALGYLPNIRVITSSDFLQLSDSIVHVNALASITLTMPPSGWPVGKLLTIKDVSGNAENTPILFTASVGTTLGEPFELNENYGSYTIYLDNNAVWRIQ